MEKTYFIGATLAMAIMSANVSAAIVTSGEIFNIDGDGDGSVDDLLIQTISFDVTAGTSLLIDSLVWESTGVDLNGDGEITGFDNYMLLFQGGTQITGNDDAALGADGSVHNYDSQIAWTFATAGTYSVSVGQLSYSLSDALLGYQVNRSYADYTNTGKTHGDWQLTFNVQAGSLSNVTNGVSAVPVPAAVWLFGSGLIGLIGVARRKKA